MAEESKISFISGLGADKRVFTKLKIAHPSQIHIEWEIPFKNEPLKDYCIRLLSQIDQSAGIILIGVSFGGIIAQELSELIPTKKIIIISSVKNRNEMDWQLRLVSKTNIYKIFPAAVLKFFNMLTADYYFSTKTKEESILLHKIIDDSNPVFNEWAIDQIMKWDNKKQKTFLHIHGTKDRIFPISGIKNYMPISNGGHFMIYSRADEVSEIINEYL